jgi:chromosome segregation ATPase
MTPEERFARIEHVTAALAEERRSDREEYKQLWRDAQRRMDDLTEKIAATNATITRLSEETDRKMNRLSEDTDRKINQLVEQDRRLGERIDALVSAIGALAQQRR